MNGKYLIALAFVVMCVAAFVVNNQRSLGATFNDPRSGVPHIASTTTYTLATGASTRLIATSSKRTALALQTVNCTASGYAWLNFNDKLAATSTGYFMTASSTVVFGDSVPMVYGSIRVLSGTPGCSVIVTEFAAPV